MAQTPRQALTIEQIQDFKGSYPKQIWYLFFSEMWERFAFYGMRGMLTIFMVEQLLMSEKDANLKYGAIQAFIYTMAFIGGFFADKLLGFRKSIFWGGLLMIIGSFTLAFSPKDLYYIGISLNIVGTGFFKPNISTMVGGLYKPGDPRRDAGFGLFYSGINIGAFLGGILCIGAADFKGWPSQFLNDHSWNIAFSLAGIGMIIGLGIFIFTQNSLATIGLSPIRDKYPSAKVRMYDLMVYGGSILAIPLILLLISNSSFTDYFMYVVGPLAMLYIIYELFKYSKAEQQKIWAALIFIIFSIVFWSFFEQAGGSLSLFARYNLHKDLLGIPGVDPNGVNNAANSLFVIVFSPIVGIIWLKLSKRKFEPNTIIKFALGFLFLGLAFYVFFATRFFADAAGMTSLNVFTLAYLVITFGELCLSPIGLSLMTKLAPKPLHGMMMGMWFLASAYGQYAAGILGAGMATPNEKASLTEKLLSYTDGYQHLAIYAVIAGVLLIVLSPLIKKLMHEVH